MSDAYRNENQAAVEHLEAVLRENAELRAKVQALEAGRAPTSRSPVWIIVASVAGIVITAGVAASLLLVRGGREQRAEIATPAISQSPDPPSPPSPPPQAPPVPSIAMPPTPPPVPAEAAAPVAPPSPGMQRAADVIEEIRRSDLVGRCWTAATRRNPTHSNERLSVTVTVDAHGRGTPTIQGASDSNLESCIRSRLSALHFSVGQSVTAQVWFTLSAGG